MHTSCVRCNRPFSPEVPRHCLSNQQCPWCWMCVAKVNAEYQVRAKKET